MKNKVVIYTAICGNKDNLMDPGFISEGCDYVCFTDNEKIESKIWQVKIIPPISDDPVRSAKIFKILPHSYFKDYEYSIWVDGNMKIISDIKELINKYLQDSNMAAFDHRNTSYDSRDCIYKEADSLLESERIGRRRDNPDLIKKQIERYKKEGYPKDNGLIMGMILVRRHNEPDVVKVMENWWSEIKDNSRRDQLSFNYVAWKNNFKFNYIDGDARDNRYFKHTLHNSHKKSLFKRIFNRLFCRKNKDESELK